MDAAREICAREQGSAGLSDPRKLSLAQERAETIFVPEDPWAALGFYDSEGAQQGHAPEVVR
jgi:hypothetical protein